MKRGTTPTLKVELIQALENIGTVEFLFKQEPTEEAPALLKKTYPSETVTLSNNVFYLAFTAAETRCFRGDSRFYLDVRPTLLTGAIPETETVMLTMKGTLFEEDA